MIEYEFSEHAFDMLKERDISENWVKSTIEASDIKESKDDGTVHYNIDPKTWWKIFTCCCKS